MKYLLIIILFLSLSSPVFSESNLTITCSESENCIKSSNESLFNEINLYPGSSVSQSLKVINSKNDTCDLNLSTSGNSTLSKDLYLTVKYDSSLLYTNNLAYFFDNKIYLGSINPNSQIDYLWTVTFDNKSDNSSQNINAGFDLDFNFTCDNETQNILGVSTNKHKNLFTFLSSFCLLSLFLYSIYRRNRHNSVS